MDTFMEVDIYDPKIDKRIGNYDNILYYIVESILNNNFNLEEFIGFVVAKETEVNYCETSFKGTIQAEIKGKGAFGETGVVSLCESPRKCGLLQQLDMSFDRNGGFSIFNEQLVKKRLTLESGEIEDEVIYAINGVLEKIKLDIPNHHTIPERYIEIISNNILNTIYFSGQNPHVVKTYGVYPCTGAKETLDIVMEYADRGNLDNYLTKNNISSNIFYSIFMQLVMGSYSMVSHAGVLHMDAHQGNIFIKKFSGEHPQQKYFAGQDMFGKRYLHYTNLPEDIFGVSDIYIETYDNLVKLGDYGVVAIDLTQANNPYLNLQGRFSSMGENYQGNLANFNNGTIRVYRHGDQGYRDEDIYSNLCYDFFNGNNNSSVLFFSSYRLMEQLFYTNSDLANEFNGKLTSVFRKHISEEEMLRSKYSRSGRGLMETYLQDIVSEFCEVGVYNGRKIALLGDFTDKLDQESIVVDWKGFYTNTMFTSLGNMRQAFNCQENCGEIDKLNKTFNPELVVRDNYELKDSITYGKNFSIKTYRLYPSMDGEPYYYLSNTSSPGNRSWPPEIRNKPIQGLLAKAVSFSPSKVNGIKMFKDMDLYSAAKTINDSCIAINANYFLINYNLINALGNIDQGSKQGDPVGISYFEGKMYVNPFPPVYNPYLVYVCVKKSGEQIIIPHNLMREKAGEKGYLRETKFSYLVNYFDEQYIFTRRLIIPDLEEMAIELDVDTIYQVGPVLIDKVNGFTFGSELYDLEFRISQKDIDQVVDITPPFGEDPNVLLGLHYNVFALVNQDGVAESPDRFGLFNDRGYNSSIIYGMNASDKFMVHNILLVYRNKDYKFLLVSGRGYGSMGIDRAQLTRFIQNTPDLSNNLLYAVSLDGGFSANAFVKDKGMNGKEYYQYALEDPQKRKIGLGYLIY